MFYGKPSGIIVIVSANNYYYIQFKLLSLPNQGQPLLQLDTQLIIWIGDWPVLPTKNTVASYKVTVDTKAALHKLVKIGSSSY